MIVFLDWRKGKTKEETRQFHGVRVFELIFGEKMTELGLNIDSFQLISIYCLADERKKYSYKKEESIGNVSIMTPYDCRNFMALESNEEKYEEFERLIYLYAVPVLKDLSPLPEEKILEIVQDSLEEIVRQNYEIVFLVGKTPKKSPSRKKIAILRGIHRAEGFQLYCEVFNTRGYRLANQLLVEEVGNEFAYARFLGELKWEDDSTIIVKSRTSSWQVIIEIEEGKRK